MDLAETLEGIRDQNGKSLLQLSRECSVFVTLLRRTQDIISAWEIVAVLSEEYERALDHGKGQVVFVHEGTSSEVDEFLKKHGVEGAHCFGDPDNILVRAFEQRRENFSPFYEPGPIRRMFRAIFRSEWAKKKIPLCFLLRNGQIEKAYPT